MRYYSTIFLSGILLALGGGLFLFDNPLGRANIPDNAVSVSTASAVNTSPDIEPHRGSGR